MKPLIAYGLISKKNFVVFDERLPIYWRKDVATAHSYKTRKKVITVKIEEMPIQLPE